MEKSFDNGSRMETISLKVVCPFFPGRKMDYPAARFTDPDGSVLILPNLNGCMHFSQNPDCQRCVKSLLDQYLPHHPSEA